MSIKNFKINMSIIAATLVFASNYLPVYADSVHSLNVDDVGSYEAGEEINSLVEGSLEGSAQTEVTAELGSSYTVVLPKKIHLQHTSGDAWKGNYQVKAKGNIRDSEYIEIKPAESSFVMKGKDSKEEIDARFTQNIITMRNEAKKTDSDALFESGSGKYTALDGSVDTSIFKADKYEGLAYFTYALKQDGGTDDTDREPEEEQEERSDLKYKLHAAADSMEIVSGDETLDLWAEDEDGNEVFSGFYTTVESDNYSFLMMSSGGKTSVYPADIAKLKPEGSFVVKIKDFDDKLIDKITIRYVYRG